MRRRSRSRRRCAAIGLLAVGATLSGTGCYAYHVYQVGGPAGRELGNQPSTEWRRATLHAFAWGLVRQDARVDDCRLGDGRRLGIEEVRIGTNLGFVVASAATLGLWVPLQVSWRCARPPVPTGVIR